MQYKNTQAQPEQIKCSYIPLFPSTKALITFPKADKERLILEASNRRSPVAPTRSNEALYHILWIAPLLEYCNILRTLYN